MASEREADERRHDPVIMRPYWVPRSGWRYPGFWLAPSLALLCFIYGGFFALTAHTLIVLCVVPLAVLALLAIWALPDAGSAPVRALAPLAFAFVIVLIIWPPYLGFQVAGTPWITPLRLVGFPLAAVFLVSVSTSAEFRAELAETLGAAPTIWKLMVTFAAIQFVTLPMAGHALPGSLQKFVLQEVDWIAMFFIGCWIFRKPGRVEWFAKAIWVMAALVSVIAIIEFHRHKLPWDGHIPSFLKIDQTDRYMEAKLRTATGLYRAKSTFTTPLGLAEFLAVSVPFVLHFSGRRRVWYVRLASLLSLPLIVYAIKETDSRSGLIATMAAILGCILIWAIKRWRSDSRGLIGPAIFMAYPAMAAMAIALTFLSHRLHTAFWGGGATKASNAGRALEWRKGIPKILHNPFGYGDGRAGDTLQVMGAYGGYTVDGYYLTLMLDYGILGCLAFIGIFGAGMFYACRSIWLIADRTNEDPEFALLAPLAVAIGAFMLLMTVLSQEDLHPLLFLILGIIVALTYRVRVFLRTPAALVVGPSRGALPASPARASA